MDNKKIKPNYYEDYEITPAEFIIRNKLEFGEGNVIKYVCRHERKNGLEDLLKARQYINLIIRNKYPEYEQKDTPNT